MKIPNGVQPGAKLLMRGKGGVMLRRGGKADQIVHLKIEIPKKLTERQKEIMQEFQDDLDGKVKTVLEVGEDEAGEGQEWGEEEVKEKKDDGWFGGLFRGKESDQADDNSETEKTEKKAV